MVEEVDREPRIIKTGGQSPDPFGNAGINDNEPSDGLKIDIF